MDPETLEMTYAVKDNIPTFFSYYKRFTPDERAVYATYKAKRNAGNSHEKAIEGLVSTTAAAPAAAAPAPAPALRSTHPGHAAAPAANVGARLTFSGPARAASAPITRHFFIDPASGELQEASGSSDFVFGTFGTFGDLIAAGLDGAVRIGGGAHGSVFKYDFAGGSYIIKRINPPRPDQIKEIRMLGEAQRSGYAMKLLAAQVGEDDSPGYILSDYIPGVTLLDWISRNRSTADFQRKYKEIINQIIDGLHALHAVGVEIIHRDIKPENIWVPDSGHIFFLDFGSAAKLGRQSEYLGTNGYARPNNIGKYREAKVINNYYALASIITEGLGTDNEGLSEYYKSNRRTRNNGTRKFSVGGKRRSNKRTTRRSRYGRH
jgi:serine/threonine protein kinase